jgi:O-antigen/teichoic acid export membrane protein
MASPVTLDIMNRWAVPGGLRRALGGGAGQRTGLLASAWWSFASAVVARGTNVLVLMICARVMAQARFGELAIIQSTVGMFGPLAGLGLGMTTTKYLAEFRHKDPARAGSILGLSLMAAVLSGLLMSGLLIALAPMLAARTLGSPRLANNLVVGSGLLFFGVVEAVQTGALTGLEAFYRIARLSAWNGILSLPLTAYLVYRHGVNGALIGMTGSVALACLFNGIVLRRESRRCGLKATLRGCCSEWPILLRFSLPSYLGGIIVAPASWAANALLVNRPGGYPEMALFSAADRWRYFLIFVPISVSRIAVPVFSRFRSAGDQAGYRGAYRANLLLGAVLTVVPAILCGLFSAPLMGTFGSSFRRGWLVMAILALSAIPTVLNTQLGAVLLSHNRAWTRMAIDVVLAGLFIGIALWAVPRWAAAGLAGAFAAAYTVTTLILMVCVRKIHAKA